MTSSDTDANAPDSDATAEGTAEAGAPETPQRLDLDVKVEEKSACERHVVVTVSRADIDRYAKEKFDELMPKAEVPGFRMGRAPRKLIEARFREQIDEQVKGAVLMDSMTQVNEECDFSAISEPDFDFEAVSLPEDGPLTFEFDIEVRPEFDLPEWKGLKLTRLVHQFTDDEVTARTEQLLERHSKMVDVDSAESGDSVRVELKFDLEDKEISKYEGNLTVRPKISFSDAEFEGFDELVKGAAIGDVRNAKVTVSEGATNEELQGKELDMTVTVQSIKRRQMPALTPQFLDEIGGFEDEQDMHEAVRQELEKQLLYHQQQDIRKQITGTLTEGADWDLPPDLLKRQARRELERMVLELRSNKFPEEQIQQYVNQMQQNVLQSTERSLKEHFILERIAEEHELDAAQADFDNEILSIAAQSSESPRRVRARLEKRGQMDALRNQIVENKCIAMITAEAEFEDKDQSPQAGMDETFAIPHNIGGETKEIAEAKYGGDSQPLPNRPEHS